MRKTFDALTDISTRIAKSYPVAEAAQRKTMIRESVADATGTAYAAHERITGSNLLTWVEAEYESVPQGAMSSATLGSGNTATVTLTGAKHWLVQARTSGSTADYVIPFPGWVARTEGVVGDYIFSAAVQNPGVVALTVWLSCEVASDASGTGATMTVTGAPVTLAPGAGDRVFIRFTYDPANPYIRFYHHLGLAGGSVQWIRQMLEPAGATQSLPGPYRPPAMNENAVTSPLVATNAIGDPEIQDTVIDHRQTKAANKNGLSTVLSIRTMDGQTGSCQPYCATPFMHYPKAERIARLEHRKEVAEAPCLEGPEFNEANFRALLGQVADLKAFTIELSHMLMDYRHMSGDEREKELETDSEWAREYKAKVLAHEFPELAEEHQESCREKDRADKVRAGILPSRKG